MATKSKVDRNLIGLRIMAAMFILFGLFVLLQSIINFKDAQYYVSEKLPDKVTAFIIKHGAGYMANWVYSGHPSQAGGDFEEIYRSKVFDEEAQELLKELMPLNGVAASLTGGNGATDEKEIEITQALVSRRTFKYLNKGYRFFITRGDEIVYQDNDLIARDMKSLATVEDILKKIPEKQRMTQVSRDPAAPGYETYVTIAGYYFADYNLGFIMVLCASAGFVLCMFGIIMLERLAGRKIRTGRTRIQYFNKGFIETILAVFLVSSFNITAIIQYVWAEYQLTDFFESGKALYVTYAGAGLYIVVTLWTITKVGAGLNIAEQNADILKKMKTDLIANVAHDIATPLTSIVGYVELLEREESLSKEAKDYVDVLKSKSQRLKNILSDLFDLSKISTESNITTAKLDLVELINQTLAEMEDRIEKSGLEIKKRIPDTAVYINADGNKLYRVFQNIIDNALKYTLQGTPINIVLTANSKKAVFEIKNTSSYEMTFTEQDVLERFVRGDRSRTEEGSGLGLSIADTFTKACGGDFKVKIDGDQFIVLIDFKRE